MTPLMIICILAFLGVAGLIGALAFIFADNGQGRVAERLDTLTGRRKKLRAVRAPVIVAASVRCGCDRSRWIWSASPWIR